MKTLLPSVTNAAADFTNATSTHGLQDERDELVEALLGSSFGEYIGSRQQCHRVTWATHARSVDLYRLSPSQHVCSARSNLGMRCGLQRQP